MKLRTRWMMKHPLQTKYLLIVVLAMLVPTLAIGFCFYNLVFNLLALQLVFPEAIMANLVPVIERVNVLLAVSLPLLAILVLWFALIISHRFAGPIERLERELDRILGGDHSRRIEMREKDDLKGVGNRINALLDKLAK